MVAALRARGRGGHRRDHAVARGGGHVAQTRARVRQPGGDCEIKRGFAAQVAEEIADAITKAETQLKELSTPGVLRGLIEPGPGVAQRWEAAPLSARREIARIVPSACFDDLGRALLFLVG